MSTVSECIEENDKWLQRENNSLDWYRNSVLEALAENELSSIAACSDSYRCAYRDGTSKILSRDLSGWQVIYETALVTTAAWEFQSLSILDETDHDILVDETVDLIGNSLNLFLLSLQTSFNESPEMVKRLLDSVSRSDDARAYFLETNAIPFCCWLVLTMEGKSHPVLADCNFGIYQEAANAVKAHRSVSPEYLRSLCDWHLSNNEYTDEGEVHVFRRHPFNFISVEIHLLDKVLNQRGQRLPRIDHELLDSRFAVPDTLDPANHRESLSEQVATALGARSILTFLSQ